MIIVHKLNTYTSTHIYGDIQVFYQLLFFIILFIVKIYYNKKNVFLGLRRFWIRDIWYDNGCIWEVVQ